MRLNIPSQLAWEATSKLIDLAKERGVPETKTDDHAGSWAMLVEREAIVRAHKEGIEAAWHAIDKALFSQGMGGQCALSVVSIKIGEAINGLIAKL